METLIKELDEFKKQLPEAEQVKLSDDLLYIRSTNLSM